MNRKWATQFKPTGSRIGFQDYANQIVSPEGKEITISHQEVITGKTRTTKLPDGYYRCTVVEWYNNKPKPCTMCEEMIGKLNA